jgi:protein translocase SecG subunit
VKTLFNYITAFSAVILITTILLQSRGSSLGAGFGSDNTFYRSKRGAELVLYYVTIGAAVIFVVAIILSILSKR